MFSDEDYKDYFSQITKKEWNMIMNTITLLDELSDVKDRDVVLKIMNDEARHYLMVRGLYDSLMRRDGTEKRCFTREIALGRVRIRELETGRKLNAVGIDVSQGGLGIEFEEKISTGSSFELWVDFFQKKEPFHCFGKLVWSKKISPDLSIGYVGGIALTAGS